MLIQYRDNYDPDAAIYLDAVETADGESLEAEVKRSISRFVKGCKNDGIWNAIKASCILAGARTLNGALVPLVGTAPINYNFVTEDYSRTNGLTGNATNKYLLCQRKNNDDPQNSKHLVTGISNLTTTNQVSIGGNDAVQGDSGVNFSTGNTMYPRINYVGGLSTSVPVVVKNGVFGASRSSATTVNYITGNVVGSIANTSYSPLNVDIHVFRRGSGFSSDSTIYYYSIGEDLDLTKYNRRIQLLKNSIVSILS